MDFLDLPPEIIWYIMDMCDKESLCVLLNTGNAIIRNIIISDKRQIIKEDKKFKYITYIQRTYVEKIIVDLVNTYSFIILYLFGGDQIREEIEGYVNYYVFIDEYYKYMRYLLEYKKVKIDSSNWVLDYYYSSAYNKPPSYDMTKLILENQSYEFEVAPYYVNTAAEQKIEEFVKLKELFVKHGLISDEDQPN